MQTVFRIMISFNLHVDLDEILKTSVFNLFIYDSGYIRL